METAAQDASVTLDYYYNENYYVGSGLKETVTETPQPTQEAEILTPEVQELDITKKEEDIEQK